MSAFHMNKSSHLGNAPFTACPKPE